MKNIRLIHLLFLGIWIYISGCTTMQKRTFDNIVDNSSIDKYIDWLIEDSMHKQNIRALSIAIIEQQKISYAKGFGYLDKLHQIKVTKNTLYRTASISKFFTALAMMKLTEAKKIDIDIPLTKYLPSFNFKKYPHDNKKVTIRTILTHHAGIPDIASGYELSNKPMKYDEVLEKLKGEYLTAPVGSIYNYSNLGIAILGGVVENTTHKAYDKYMQSNILKPMGMHQSKFTTQFYQDKYPYQYVSLPTMGLVSNVIDLSKVMITMNNKGMYGDKRIFKRGTVEEVLKVQNKSVPLDMGKEFALALEIDKESFGEQFTVYSRTGNLESNRACMMFMPALKIGVVILSNADTDISKIKAIAHKAMIKLWEKKTKKKYKDIRHDNFKIVSYDIEGIYNANFFGAIRIFKKDNNIYVMQQLSSKESLILKKNKDGSYGVKQDGFYLLNANPFLNKKLYFSKIDNKKVVVIEDGNGNRSIGGFKVEKYTISSNWEKALGEYVNQEGSISTILKYENKALIRAYKKDGKEIFSEIIRPVNRYEAIVDNFTSKARITLRIEENNHQFKLYDKGMVFID